MKTSYYVANRVREERKAAKLRQEDLARLVGVSRQTIIAIEGGRLTKPSIATCLMLGRVLNQPVEYLFYLVPKRADAEKGVEDENRRTGYPRGRAGAEDDMPLSERAGEAEDASSSKGTSGDDQEEKPHAIFDFGG